MEIHSTKLVIYSTLVALGVILMLLGISWLMFLGIALIMLSAHFSSRKAGRRLLRPTREIMSEGLPQPEI